MGKAQKREDFNFMLFKTWPQCLFPSLIPAAEIGFRVVWDFVGLCHGKLLLAGREQEGWGCVWSPGPPHVDIIYSCKMHQNSPFPPIPLHVSAAEVEFAIVTHSWQDEAGLYWMLKEKYLLSSTFLSRFLPYRYGRSVWSCRKAEFSTQW